MKIPAFVYEIPLFFAFLFAVNYFLFPLNLGFSDVEPHPFWIGVLIFAFRYGLLPGLFAGAIAAGGYLGLMWFFGEPYQFEDATFYFLPTCFVLVGILLGAGVDRYRDRVAYLTRWRSQLMDRIKILEDEIHSQKDIVAGLEKRIVTKMNTLITVYEGARKLETNNFEELYRAIVLFIAKTLDAEEAALYFKTPDGWELKVSQGWKDQDSRPSRLGLHEGITGKAGMSGKVVSVKDILKQEDVTGVKVLELKDSILSGPLCLGEGGDVVGVLSIQSLDFLNFNSATINLFQFLLSWASRSLGRAHYIQGLRINEVLDPELGVYTQHHFNARAKDEFLRSRTYYLPLSLALIQICPMVSLSASKRRHFVEIVAEFLRHSCRGMDVVARFEDKDVDFGILLVTTSQAQAGEFKDKLMSDFAQLGIKSQIELKIQLASFTPQTESMDSLLSRAREELAHAKIA